METPVPRGPRPQPRATPPDALLLIASQCPHCQAVLDALTGLVKEGLIGRLTVVNVSVTPEAPEARGIRAAPWTRIGPFELGEGLSAAELKDWVAAAATGQGWRPYFSRLLETGRLDALVAHLHERPGNLADLLSLFTDPDTPFAVRIGISAAMENLSGSAPLRQAVPQILPLTLSGNPQIRADVCHFLGLAGDPAASAWLRRLLDDEDLGVREVAAEALALLGASDQSRPEPEGP